MEDVWENIDKKYDIIEKKGSGISSVVYLVKDSTTKKTYAAKILKKQDIVFKNEVDILNALKEAQNPYILNLVNSGTGNVVLKDKDLKEKQYLILEYASKGNLFYYTKQYEQGLKKEYAKVIFDKILKGVLCCHEKGICHRDLKLDNILLDENFNPKIADFGFSTSKSEKVSNDGCGTEGYSAPEIYYKKVYNGIQADIFSLGVILFNLYIGNAPFKIPLESNIFYNNIFQGNYPEYWALITKALEGHEKFEDFEDFKDFKELINKMICYKPEERLTIIEILESKWMKEINEDQLKKLDKEIKEELLKIEPKVLKLIANDGPIDSLKFDKGDEKDNSKKYFDLSLKPKYAKTGLGINFIKIEGDLSPANFMNNLANKIGKTFQDKCKIEESNKALKFNITFEVELEDEEEKLDIEENEDIVNLLKKNCIMQCKLYQSLNGGHILKFSKKCGNLEDYYNKLKKIISLVKKII